MSSRFLLLSASAAVSLLTLGGLRLWEETGAERDGSSLSGKGGNAPHGRGKDSIPEWASPPESLSSPQRRPFYGSAQGRPLPGAFGAPSGRRQGSALAGLSGAGNGQSGSSFHAVPLKGSVAPVITEEELRGRAAKVELAANHDLKRLVALLDLDEQQQDRIFETLAQRSPDWHPLLQTSPAAAGISPESGVADASGQPQPASPASPAQAADPFRPRAPENPELSENPSSPAAVAASFPPETSLTEALAPELSPEQEVILAEDELDRLEWWESIIPRLLPDEDTEDSSSSNSSSSGGSPGGASGTGGTGGQATETSSTATIPSSSSSARTPSE